MYETNKRDYTLGEWLDIWLEEIAPTKRKPNTISIYRDARRRLLTHHPEVSGILLVDSMLYKLKAGWTPCGRSMQNQRCAISALC